MKKLFLLFFVALVFLFPCFSSGSMEVELKDSADFSTITVQNYVDSLADLPVPQKEGYNFLYWSFTPDGEKRVTEKSVINSNITLYAIWERKEYWITVYGESRTENFKLKFEDKLEQLPTGYFEKEHYDIVGWTDYGSGEQYPLDSLVKSDLSIKPVYEKHKYAVKLIYDTGIDSLLVQYGESLSSIMYFPRIQDLGIADFHLSEEGEYDANNYADFFSLAGEVYDANSIVDRDLSLSVIPKQWFNVIFYNEGEVVRKERVFKDYFADGSPLGNKSFFVYFGGWQDNGSDAVIDFSKTPIETDTEVSAVWIVNYTRIILCVLPVVIFIPTWIIVSIHKKKKKKRLQVLEIENNKERALKETKELEEMINAKTARFVTLGRTVAGCSLEAKKYEMVKEMTKMADCIDSVERMQGKLDEIEQAYKSAVNSAGTSSFDSFFRNAREIRRQIKVLEEDLANTQRVVDEVENAIDRLRQKKEKNKEESELSIAYAVFGLDINKKPTMEEFKKKRNYLLSAIHPDKFTDPKRKEWANEETAKINHFAEIIEKDLKS